MEPVSPPITTLCTIILPGGAHPLRIAKVAAGLRDPNLRKIHVFVSDPARTHLRPAEAPSAQIGLRSDLEMVTPEVATKSTSRNVVALKNKMGHQVDAGGER